MGVWSSDYIAADYSIDTNSGTYNRISSEVNESVWVERELDENGVIDAFEITRYYGSDGVTLVREEVVLTEYYTGYGSATLVCEYNEQGQQTIYFDRDEDGVCDPGEGPLLDLDIVFPITKETFDNSDYNSSLYYYAFGAGTTASLKAAYDPGLTDALVTLDVDAYLKKEDSLLTASTGEGVIIAMLDTGIDAALLDGDSYTGYDFAGSNRLDGAGDTDFSDSIGHGTKTASVISGSEGIALDADVMALKVFDDTGKTTSSIVADAIRYAVDNSARIITMPFSLLVTDEMVEDAIQYAKENNVLLIAAAGNEGKEILDSSLAANDNVITVGSVEEDGSMSAWSNYGSELDLLAPWDVVTLEGAEGEAGTSFSAAFVAGMAALIMADDPGISVEDVLQKLQTIAAGAEDNEAGYDGYGLITPAVEVAAEETVEDTITENVLQQTEIVLTKTTYYSDDSESIVDRVEYHDPDGVLSTTEYYSGDYKNRIISVVDETRLTALDSEQDGEADLVSEITEEMEAPDKQTELVKEIEDGKSESDGDNQPKGDLSILEQKAVEKASVEEGEIYEGNIDLGKIKLKKPE